MTRHTQPLRPDDTPSDRLLAPSDSPAKSGDDRSIRLRSDGLHGPRWVIRSHTVARDLIRREGAVRQAGFGADRVRLMSPSDRDEPSANTRRRSSRAFRRMRAPILYLDGPEHRERRRATARLFTPKATETLRPMVERLADEVIAEVTSGQALTRRRGRDVDLSKLSLRMAVGVTAEVVGLTSSSLGGLTRRIAALGEADLAGGHSGLRDALLTLRGGLAVARFYRADVRPAIRDHRKLGPDDVIGILIAEGWRPLEILTECVTYGAAGMFTTRELITLAAWHLLQDPSLLSEYRGADGAARLALVTEILRLDPVIGHLYRRTDRPLTATVNGSSIEVPMGTLLDLDVAAINADETLVGAQPLKLCAGRPLTRSDVSPAVLSFSDGHHRCPGAQLALLETEIFLSRLFVHDVVLVRPPTVTWNELTAGCELRDLRVRVSR